MRKVPYPHPGEILLEEFLKPMGITQYRLAKEIGVPQRRIGEIVAGARGVTADTGLRLARFFGMSEGFWIGLQMDYEAANAKDVLYKLLHRPGDQAPGAQPPAGEPAETPRVLSVERVRPRKTHTLSPLHDLGGSMKRVTGIGGIFFKAKDAPALRAWYKRHLGIDVQEWGGAAFTWTDGEGRPVAGTTAWLITAAQSDQFAPSTATFMVNYRVEDLHALVKILR